jgi:sulfite reductase beta subunit-like hemoprotein
MSSVAEPSPITRENFEQEHEQTVREEIERFRAKAQQVLSGAITDDEFRGFRLRYGIYGQRQPGVQMVRTNAYEIPQRHGDRAATGAAGRRG